MASISSESKSNVDNDDDDDDVKKPPLEDGVIQVDILLDLLTRTLLHEATCCTSWYRGPCNYFEADRMQSDIYKMTSSIKAYTTQCKNVSQSEWLLL